MSEPPVQQQRPIGNQAKRPDDAITKGGATKLKFVPTFTARKKPAEPEVKQEPASAPPAGRGAEVMAASGPFAMGPALGTGRRAAPRSVFAPVAPSSIGAGSSSSLSGAPPPPVFKKERVVKLEDDADNEAEQYSDADAGVEIVDLADVRRMDYMAPETLRKEKKTKPKVKVEVDESEIKLLDFTASSSRAAPLHPEEIVLADVDDQDEIQELARAVTGKQDDMEIISLSQELFLFQFPEPFPTFLPSTPAADAMDVDAPAASPTTAAAAAKSAIKSEKAKGKEKAVDGGSTGAPRHVSFADEVKPLGEDEEVVNKKEKGTPLDGHIGQLEVYEDGSVRMRLGDGVLLSLSAGTPASYLQQAVHLDRENKKMVVLGEVRQRYTLSPDLDRLLDELQHEDDIEQLKPSQPDAS